MRTYRTKRKFLLRDDGQLLDSRTGQIIGNSGYGNAVARLFYSSSEVEEDPGNGYFRFGDDGGWPYIISSYYDADGNDLGFLWFGMMAPEETLLIMRKRYNPAIFLFMVVVDVVDEGDYAAVSIWPIFGSAEEFENGDEVMVSMLYALEGPEGEAGEPGLIWTGAWSAEALYSPGHAVSNNGSSYICIVEHEDQEPPNAGYWDVLAQGA